MKLDPATGVNLELSVRSKSEDVNAAIINTI